MSMEMRLRLFIQLMHQLKCLKKEQKNMSNSPKKWGMQRGKQKKVLITQHILQPLENQRTIQTGQILLKMLIQDGLQLKTGQMHQQLFMCLQNQKLRQLHQILNKLIPFLHQKQMPTELKLLLSIWKILQQQCQKKAVLNMLYQLKKQAMLMVKYQKDLNIKLISPQLVGQKIIPIGQILLLIQMIDGLQKKIDRMHLTLVMFHQLMKKRH